MAPMKKSAPQGHWIVKQEPTAYSWDQFVKDGVTSWTGVRNFLARNNLAAMELGDQVLYYHSVVGKEIVGIAKVTRKAYADPTATEGDWKAVDLKPVRALKRPVTLEEMKADPALKEILLIRQSRLSVSPISAVDFARIVEKERTSA